MALIKHNNNSISNVTSFAQVPAGEPVLLSTATASSSASIEFTSGIDSTYQVYKFEYNSLHPSTDGVYLQFNLSSDGGSNYNVTKTSTSYHAFHNESDTVAVLGYDSVGHLAQSTGNQYISNNIGNDNDQTVSGTLFLFNPSSTTYVKHYISNTNASHQSEYTINTYVGGYGNTTSSINAIRFIMTSGNIDAGQIKLYGIGAN